MDKRMTKRIITLRFMNYSTLSEYVRIEVGWTHGKHFSPTCASCKSGLASMNALLEHLDDSVITSDLNEEELSFEKIVFSVPDSTKVVPIPRQLSVEGLKDYILETFDATMKLGHIENFYMKDIGGVS